MGKSKGTEPNLAIAQQTADQIFSVPTTKAIPVWGRGFTQAQLQPSLLKLVEAGGAQSSQAIALQWTYAYAFHWAYKTRWDAKHKIPDWKKLQPGTRQAIKILGGLLVALMELCVQTYVREEPYGDGGEWFTQVVWEMKEAEINSIREQDNLGKPARIQYHKRISGCFRKHENPFTLALEPHSHRLVKKALALAGQYSKYSSNHWMPYLSAYTAFIKTLGEACWVDMFERNGILCYHPGPGRAVLKV